MQPCKRFYPPSDTYPAHMCPATCCMRFTHAGNSSRRLRLSISFLTPCTGAVVGICDGYTYEGIKEKWPETYAARKADKLNFRYPAGESYMDVVKRLESVIIEVERENESVCIVGHQAILRCVYAYFMHVPREDVRSLSA